MSYPRDLDEYTDQELSEELTARAARRYLGTCDYCSRFKDQGVPCRFPRRHMQALTMHEAQKFRGT